MNSIQIGVSTIIILSVIILLTSDRVGALISSHFLEKTEQTSSTEINPESIDNLNNPNTVVTEQPDIEVESDTTTSQTIEGGDLVTNTQPGIVSTNIDSMIKTSGGSMSEYRSFGLRFWEVLSSADVTSLEDYYASQVVLLAGSELLEPKYGLNPGTNTTKDLILDSEMLIKGYEKMISLVGADEWRSVLTTEIDADDFSFYYTDDQALRGLPVWTEYLQYIDLGDKKQVVMYLDDSLSLSEGFMFFLEQTNLGIRVTMELTDY